MGSIVDIAFESTFLCFNLSLGYILRLLMGTQSARDANVFTT